MRQKLLFGACIALACLACIAVFSFAGKGEQAGKVVAVKGAVTVVHEGEVKAVPIAVKDPVLVGDKIMTAERSRVKLLMKDDSVLTLGQKAAMTIQEYTLRPDEKKRSSVVRLASGNLKSVVTKFFTGAGSKFEVHTPTAVAGARGTTNLNAVLSPGRTLTVGLDGTTRVQNIDQGVSGFQDLTGGMGSYTDDGQPPSDPFQLDSGQLGQLEDDTELGREPQFSPEGEGGGVPLLTPEGGPEPPAPDIPPVQQEPQPHEIAPVGNIIFINNIVP